MHEAEPSRAGSRPWFTVPRLRRPRTRGDVSTPGGGGPWRNDARWGRIVRVLRSWVSREPVLPPYTSGPIPLVRVARRSVAFGALALFMFVYGAAFGLFGEAFPFVFVVPIGILLLIVIWALPDLKEGPVRTLEVLFFIFLVVQALWPSYLAVAIPGLPAITMVRITGAPFAVVLLMCVSTSRAFRRQLSEALSGAPLVWGLYVAFIAIQGLSILFSPMPLFSIDRFASAQLAWTAIFFGSCYLMAKPGVAMRWVKVMWAMSIVVGLLAIWERHLQHVPWAGHIPGFLKINDERVAEILAGRIRAYGGGYRAESTFAGPIELGEWLAFLMPFILHLAMTSRRRWTRRGAIATIPFLSVIVFIANARSGMFGWLISFILYGAYWGYRRWRFDRTSLFGALVFFGYPLAGLLAILPVFFVGRVRSVFWGTGSALGSTDARKQQWALGWPKVIRHPWGYGIGLDGDVVGWVSPGGFMSIDTYYLSILVEYGFVGFIVYFGIFAMAIFEVVRLVLSKALGEDEEASLVVPAGIAMANFVVIKSVFSQEDNHSIVFMILGMLIALSARLKRSPELALASARAQPRRAVGQVRRPSLARG
jgi:O-Antigen ligase